MPLQDRGIGFPTPNPSEQNNVKEAEKTWLLRSAMTEDNNCCCRKGEKVPDEV